MYSYCIPYKEFSVLILVGKMRSRRRFLFGFFYSVNCFSFCSWPQSFFLIHEANGSSDEALTEKTEQPKPATHHTQEANTATQAQHQKTKSSVSLPCSHVLHCTARSQWDAQLYVGSGFFTCALAVLTADLILSSTARVMLTALLLSRIFLNNSQSSSVC